MTKHHCVLGFQILEQLANWGQFCVSPTYSARMRHSPCIVYYIYVYIYIFSMVEFTSTALGNTSWFNYRPTYKMGFVWKQGTQVFRVTTFFMYIL
jgi:hypothetical protein